MTGSPLPRLLDCAGVQRELGVKRVAAEAIMRDLPKFSPPGVRKVYVRREDVLAYIEEHTEAA